MSYVYVALSRFATGVVRVLVPSRHWYTYRPSAEQLFSDADEEITRRVNDEIK